VILADTSAWVEYLRATGSPVHGRLRRLIAEDGELATTEVVVMELLAGAGSPLRRRELRRLLLRFPLLATEGLSDYEHAGELYAVCRERGETIRSLNDCLVAAVALREAAAVLQRDRDFDVIARHAPLALDHV
jgi:predicted nucleic acid-binding protein